MALQDGRFLTAAERYDLLEEKLRETAKLVRVSENFRVIATGLPVPPFPGFPLDPPLRSRFVARTITPLPQDRKFQKLFQRFREIQPTSIRLFQRAAEEIRNLFQQQPVGAVGGVLHCPEWSVISACATMERFPAEFCRCVSTPPLGQTWV